MNAHNYLAVEDLSRHFQAHGRTVRSVDGVSFAIPAGSTFSLVGESGCGKTTLARVIAGLDRARTGALRFTRPAGAIGARVDELLGRVGLAAADGAKFPHEFSGGQRQRIAIALAGEPSFLVCDEPTSALDVSVQAQILNLLKRLEQEEGLTSLFISHNLAVVRFVSTRIGVMYLGRLVEVADTEALFAAPRHPYTQLLLAAIPRVGQGRRAAGVPAGELPSPLAPPPGCAFHPRCPAAAEICRREAPRLSTLRDEAAVACHAVGGAAQPVRFMPRAA